MATQPMPKWLNVYQDPHSGGWVREVLALGEWSRDGSYGTRAAAMRGTGSAAQPPSEGK